MQRRNASPLQFTTVPTPIATVYCATMGHLIHRSRIKIVKSSNGNEEEKERSKPWRLPRQATPRPVALITALMSLVVLITFNHTGTSSPPQHVHPVMVQSLYLQHALKLSLDDRPPRYVKDRRNHYWLDHGVESWRTPSTVPEGCTVLFKQHNDHYPACNNIHGVDMTDIWLFPDRHAVTLEGVIRQSRVRHIGEGGFRNAFYISEYNGTRKVLKTMVWRDDRPFDISTYERNRKDAVIASQLTSSPLVANIYGYCAMAAFVDYSNDWDLYYIFDNGVPPRDELFDLAVDLAQSVADSHLPDENGRPTVVHMDLKPDQWIKLNGKYVLNDFNLAKFITYNEEKGEYCNQASGYSDGRWQAPEQFTSDYPRTEKADIFSLGYVLNFLLTQEKPFPELSGKETMEHVMKGGIWKVPEKYRKSSHPFNVALSKAVEDCLKFIPEERPSAQHVADFLRKAREDYKKKDETKQTEMYTVA